MLLLHARPTALTAITSLTPPLPTTLSLHDALPIFVDPGAVTVQVYNQTGPNAYLLVGNIPLTVEDHRPCPLCVTGITPNASELARLPATFSVACHGFDSNGFGLPVVNFTRAGVLLG